MSLTKAQARSMIRSLLTDAVSDFWTPAALDVLTQTVIDELWGELIDDGSNWAISQMDRITSFNSPGYIDLRTTDVGGQLSQRFYRVQKVTRDSKEYFPAQQNSVVIQDDTLVYAPYWSYVMFGNQMWLFPLDTSFEVELLYSYLPQSFTSLADNDFIIWPDGGESAFTHAAAARALIRSGNQLLIDYNQGVADNAMRKLKYTVARSASGTPFGTIAVQDDPETWGGNA